MSEFKKCLHDHQSNPEDGKICLLVPARPGCPRQGPGSREMVVCVCVITNLLRKQYCSNQHLSELASDQGRTTGSINMKWRLKKLR